MIERLSSSDRRIVGPFEVLGVLGAGGMGTVYLGRDSQGLPVAIKVVHDGLARNVEFRVRFLREARLMEQVTGRFTARFIGVDAEAVPAWIAMEYVAGPTLDAAIAKTGSLSARQTDAFALGLAAGILSLYRLGVVHRDLKPSNVILAQSGPVIVDLGIARAAEATALTATGVRLGTVAWMTPEQLAGQPESAATDVFAWACLVVFAATGAHPFGEGRPEAVALRILAGALDLSLLELVEPHLRDVLQRALVRDPDRRPGITEIVAELGVGEEPATDPLVAASTVVDRSWSPPETCDPDATQLISRAHGMPDPRDDAPVVTVNSAPPHEPLAVRSRRRRPRLRLAAAVLTPLLLIGSVAAGVELMNPAIGGSADRASDEATSWAVGTVNNS